MKVDTIRLIKPKMKNKILDDNMIVFIGKEIIVNFNSDSIINEFKIFECIILVSKILKIILNFILNFIKLRLFYIMRYINSFILHLIDDLIFFSSFPLYNILAKTQALSRLCIRFFYVSICIIL